MIMRRIVMITRRMVMIEVFTDNVLLETPGLLYLLFQLAKWILEGSEFTATLCTDITEISRFTAPIQINHRS